jgi:hypothetical protein
MSSLLGGLGGAAVGIGVGEAAATVLEPALVGPSQTAWETVAKAGGGKVLTLDQLAMLVATALNVLSDVEEDAARNGYNLDTLNSAIQLALKAPGPPDAEKLYLRSAGNYPGAITEDQLHHAYAKAGLEGQWWGPLTDAAGSQLLTPAQLALSIVRSTVNSSGLLVVNLDTSDSNVPQYPVATLDPVAEAAAFGIDAERLQVLVGDVGLPMASHEAASAYFRGIITEGAYNQAILEGDTRPEWAPFILDQSREIPTVVNALENYLRGYTTDFQTALDNAARWGMTEADATLIYQNLGRPLPVREITQGLALGASFNPIEGELQDPYQASVAESNLKQSYYDLAIAARQYLWPSYFMLEKIVPNPYSADDAAQFLEYAGYRPDVAKAVGEALAAPAATTSTPTKSAQTALLTATRKAYVGSAIDVTQATAALTTAGLTADEISQWLAYAEAQRLVENPPENA